MKRILCIILVLLMCAMVSTCGKPDVSTENEPPVTDDTADTNDVQDNGEVQKDEEPEIDPKTIWNGTLEHGGEGFYDPDYDYSANERYKICFLAYTRSEIIKAYDDAIAFWCDKFNIEYAGIKEREAVTDEYAMQLETLSGEYNGIILYPEPHLIERSVEIMQESNCAWMLINYEARDGEGILKSPFVRAKDSSGESAAEYMADYAQLHLSNIPASEIGVMYLTFSGFEVTDNRQIAFEETLKAAAPELADNIVVVDLNTQLEVEHFNAWYDTAILENPQYKYWLCFASMNNFVKDACSAFERNGIADNAFCFSLEDPYTLWEKNDYSCFVATYTLPMVMTMEPVVGALHGFMTGEYDPAYIWGGDGNESAFIDLEPTWVTRENYKDFILKVNDYAGGEFYVID